MVASIEQAQQAGALSGTEGSVLGAAAAVAPVDRILAIVRGDDDPCEPFPWSTTSSTSQALAEVALIGVVDAACQLQAPTFDVFAALANPSELATLEQTTGKSEEEINAAIKSVSIKKPWQHEPEPPRPPIPKGMGLQSIFEKFAKGE